MSRMFLQILIFLLFATTGKSTCYWNGSIDSEWFKLSNWQSELVPTVHALILGDNSLHYPVIGHPSNRTVYYPDSECCSQGSHCAQLPGDINGDGRVNINDLRVLSMNWLYCANPIEVNIPYLSFNWHPGFMASPAKLTVGNNGVLKVATAMVINRDLNLPASHHGGTAILNIKGGNVVVDSLLISEASDSVAHMKIEKSGSLRLKNIDWGGGLATIHLKPDTYVFLEGNRVSDVEQWVQQGKITTEGENFQVGCKFNSPVPGLTAVYTYVAADDKPWLNVQKVRVSAAQVEIHTGNELQVIEQHIQQAGADGSQLIVLPEYCMGVFYQDSSTNLNRIKELAQEHNIYVVIGGWEEYEQNAFVNRIQDGYSNTVVIIDRQGQIIGKYSKTHKAVGSPPYFWPPNADDAEWTMRAGSEYPVFQLDFAKIGIMVCYDGFFPESAHILSLKGAEIVLWLNGREGAIEDFIVKSDMFRSYCAMIATNLAPGSGTCIGSFPATILAQITQPGNHYITAEIDLKSLRLHRKNSRVFHQRRPEIYFPIAETHRPWRDYDGWQE